MWPSSLSPALQPRARLDARGLGWPPFARRYSGGHSCFPFLRLLGCFGSSGSPPPSGGCRALARRVAPFGHPRINGRSRLPVDFRGLPRPSSPPGAKASSVRPNSLLALSCDAPLTRTPRSSLSSLVSAFLPSCQRSLRLDAAYSPRGALVENAGLEPATPGLQSRCSSRLSQSPNASVCVVPGRLELPTPTLSVWCSNRLSYGTPPRGPPQAFQASTGLGKPRPHGRRTPGAPLQKGGVPAAPSGTATLLRLSPSHPVRPRRDECPGFRRPRLPWLDGRCVQGPGTYSPRHG